MVAIELSADRDPFSGSTSDRDNRKTSAFSTKRSSTNGIGHCSDEIPVVNNSGMTAALMSSETESLAVRDEYAYGV